MNPVIFAKSSQTAWKEAKEVILGIIQEAGGQFNGMTRLYKAFYFAHLYHWADFEGLLTTYPIVRMPNGPGIDDGESLLEQMASENLVAIGQRRNGPFPESTYCIARGVEPKLDDDQRESIRLAVAFVGEKSATELSNFTHEHSRSWQMSIDGKELDIYIDLLTEDEFEKSRSSIAQADKLLDGTFPE